MKMLKYNLVAMVTALLLPAFAAAAPLMINYQGRLVDTAGNPLTGEQTVHFKIYSVPTGGSEIWAEDQTVTPDNGIFSVALGSFTALPVANFVSDSLYLGVAIGADAEMVPRTRLLSTPYALYTSNLGSSVSQSLISTDTVISNSQLQLGNFSSLPGAIGSGALVYYSGQIYYWNNTSWIPLAAGAASAWSSSPGKVFLLDGSNDLGVGTGSPMYKLDVAGGIFASSSMTASQFFGNGSGLTGISGAQVDLSTVTAAINAGLSPVNAALSTGVYTTQFYADPAWITSLSSTKIDLSTVSASVTSIEAAISTAVYNVNFYANPAWITSLATSKIDLSTVTAEIAPLQTAAGNAAYITNSYPNPGWITSLATAKIDLSTVTAAINEGLAPVNAALSTGVYTTQTYADPSWLTSLSTSKIDLSTVSAIMQPIEAAISTAVYNVNSYSNPSWITSLATSKINLSTVTAAINEGLAPVNAALSTGVYTTQFYADPAWLTSLSTSKIDLSTVSAIMQPIEAAISTAVYSVNTYSDPSWITSLATSKINLSTVTAAINEGLAPVNAALSTGVYTTQTYADPSWITSLATSKINLSTVTTALSNADNLTSGTLASARLSGTYSNALTFGSAAGGPITFSTNVILSASQMRVGNYAAAPGAVGPGSMYYDSVAQLLYYSNNGLSWTALAAGGASPWTSGGGATTLVTASDKVGVGKAPSEKLDVAGTIKSDFGVSAATMTLSDTGAAALDVAGGITAGSGNVGIVDTTGKIPAISGTYFASLNGSALTNITASAIAAGNVTAGSLLNTVIASSIAVQSITSENQIVDGVITNADINASAAIADTKLGTISSAGKVNPGAIAAGSLLNTVIASSIAVQSITSENQIVDGVIMNGDINASAAIAISKLATTGTLGSSVMVSSIVVNSITDQNQILDGVITNADINASAAIAISKLATSGTLGADVVASSVPAANIGVGILSAAVVVSSVGVNAVHTGAIADSAVTNAKIDTMAASKLTGSLPQGLLVFVDADCDALTPAAEGQFCYDSVKHMLSISTSTTVGGYAGIAMDALTTW